MSAHTPGPWKIEPGHSVVRIKADDGYDVAQTSGSPYWKEYSKADFANANLIAAAPDLLSSMRFILAFYEPGQRHLDTKAWERAEAAARAAIAKAEGRT